MKYQEIRDRINTGDLVLVEGHGFISRAIRMVTGQNFSHVGLFLWLEGSLMIAEMKEGIGYRITPASQWVADNAYIYYGKAPAEIEGYENQLRSGILSLRGQKYGYLSLFGVWLAQFTHSKDKSSRLVCSTAVQHVWEKAGYRFEHIPDPGDFARLCQFIQRLEQ